MVQKVTSPSCDQRLDRQALARMGVLAHADMLVSQRFAAAGAAGNGLDHQQNQSAREAFAGLFAKPGLHEIYVTQEGDGVAAMGCMLALARQVAGKRPLLMVQQDMMTREWGLPYAPGFAEFGLTPDLFIHVLTQDVQSALQAGLEGARCAALGAALISFRGEARAYDLTASRRLSVAARASGLRIFLMRSAASVMPSAAETRWSIGAAPSSTLMAQAPGKPSFAATLLRQKSGKQDLRWLLEWDRDALCFETRELQSGEPATRHAPDQPNSKAPPPAPLSGLVVPLPRHRSHSSPETQEWYATG